MIMAASRPVSTSQPNGPTPSDSAATATADTDAAGVAAGCGVVGGGVVSAGALVVVVRGGTTAADVGGRVVVSAGVGARVVVSAGAGARVVVSAGAGGRVVVSAGSVVRSTSRDRVGCASEPVPSAGGLVSAPGPREGRSMDTSTDGRAEDPPSPAPKALS